MKADVVAVISDFGLARLNTATKTIATLGTEGFIAPEILDQKPYSEKADVSIHLLLLIQLDIQFCHRVMDT